MDAEDDFGALYGEIEDVAPQQGIIGADTALPSGGIAEPEDDDALFKQLYGDSAPEPDAKQDAVQGELTSLPGISAASVAQQLTIYMHPERYEYEYVGCLQLLYFLRHW
jgi:hypothetical protein